MPVTINDIDTDVDVQQDELGGIGHDASEKTQPTPQAQADWAEIARRERQRASRTAAWGFDD